MSVGFTRKNGGKVLKASITDFSKGKEWYDDAETRLREGVSAVFVG